MRLRLQHSICFGFLLFFTLLSMVSVAVAQPVVMEIPAKVEYAFRHYGDPNIARVAFASPMWNSGCSSTMIGPNFVLTAAHCGPTETEPDQTRELKFMTYRQNETERNIEIFQCRRLIHGWPRTDLAVLFCDPNGDVNPGDKYGYLDVEMRAPVVGDRVYSVWWNPVTTGPTGSLRVPLYSAGRVVRTDIVLWPDAGLDGPAKSNVGISMDTWGTRGASGSSNVDSNTHRILVAPTTRAPDPEGASRLALSMRTNLLSELLAPGTYEGAGYLENVKASNFPPGSYNFSEYAGEVDWNGNGVFDVQEDIERQRGENRRSSYWLGFDNRRRNELWQWGLVSMNYDTRQTSVNFSGAGLVLRHRFLNLKPNTSYRVGMLVKTESAGNGTALSVGFERREQPAWSVANLATTPGKHILRTAIIRTDGNPNPFFAIRTTGAFKGSVSEIQLIEDGATSSFELSDEREGWKTSFRTTAHFLPRGAASDSGGAPDFVLHVRHSTSPIGGARPVSTQKLLFLTNRVQRLCFKARSLSSTSARGTVRIKSGVAQALNSSFQLTTKWTTHCFDRIRTASTDTTLTFSSSDNRTSYLVDDVRLDADPVVAPPDEGIIVR